MSGRGNGGRGKEASLRVVSKGDSPGRETRSFGRGEEGSARDDFIHAGFLAGDGTGRQRLNEQHGTPGDLSFEQYIEQVIARRARRTNARGRTA